MGNGENKYFNNGETSLFYIENHDFLAMFTVKNRLPYKSDVKGDT